MTEPVLLDYSSKQAAPVYHARAIDRLIRGFAAVTRWRPELGDPLAQLIAQRLHVPLDWVVTTLNCTTALWAAGRLFAPQTAPVLTFAATWSATGARPVDVDNEGWPPVGTDVGVELWGRPYPHPCRILDAAHVAPCKRHGDLLRDNKVGAVCYSFGPIKEVPSPVGGALVSPRAPEVLEALHCSAGLDNTPRYSPSIALNGLLPHPLACFIAGQFARLPFWREQRKRILDLYHRALPDELVTLPDEASGHLAVLRFKTREQCLAVRRSLTRAGVEWRVHYAVGEQWPGAYDLSQRIVSLPCHTYLLKQHVERVIRRVLEA